MQQLINNGDSFGVTGTHPLYSLDRQQFIPTEDIKVGEHLLSKSGIITVVSKTYDPTPQEVYNLEVGQWHNFLVGVSGVVAHNSYWDDVLLELKLLKTEGLLAEDLLRIDDWFKGNSTIKKLLGEHNFVSWLKEVEKLGLEEEILKRVVKGLRWSNLAAQVSP